MTRRRLRRRRSPVRVPGIPRRRNPILVVDPRWTQTCARVAPTRPLLPRHQTARKNPLVSRNRHSRRERGALPLRIDLPRLFLRAMSRNRRTSQVHRTLQRNRTPRQSFLKRGRRRLLRRRSRHRLRAAFLRTVSLTMRRQELSRLLARNSRPPTLRTPIQRRLLGRSRRFTTRIPLHSVPRSWVRSTRFIPVASSIRTTQRRRLRLRRRLLLRAAPLRTLRRAPFRMLRPLQPPLLQWMCLRTAISKFRRQKASTLRGSIYPANTSCAPPLELCTCIGW